MRTRRFSRSRICSSDRARARPPRRISPGRPPPPGRPARPASNARSMAARACSSSSFSTTLWLREADGLAFDHQLLRVGEQGVEHERRAVGQLAAAQVLLGDAGQQRILRVELADGFHQAVARGLKPGAVHIPGLRLRMRQRRAPARGDLALPRRPVRATSSGRPTPNSDSRTSRRDARRRVGAGEHVQALVDVGRLCGSGARRCPPPRRRRWSPPARTCG